MTLVDLVRQALRMRPDRLVVGEVRGAEVRELLAALNTGHEAAAGQSTRTAGTSWPFEALGALAGLSRAAVHAQLASAVQAVAHVRRTPLGRTVESVSVLDRPGGVRPWCRLSGATGSTARAGHGWRRCWARNRDARAADARTAGRGRGVPVATGAPCRRRGPLGLPVTARGGRARREPRLRDRVRWGARSDPATAAEDLATLLEVLVPPLQAGVATAEAVRIGAGALRGPGIGRCAAGDLVTATRGLPVGPCGGGVAELADGAAHHGRVGATLRGAGVAAQRADRRPSLWPSPLPPGRCVCPAGRGEALAAATAGRERR